ncbi:pilus assembly protein [Acinetobacter sp. YH12219]|uniref:pilus assembly protein n=1 Tax=Acinetobacter sp. YH12219 TaxID=2601153 RepID=UPI0015D101CC|nr:PilC/PilY family type IV pilus protein [Acinetobacter sp. YH12219]
MKNGTYIKKKWMQFKVSALSTSITALIVSSIPTQISASDIDIYQSGGTGAINIYFMLDVSGSMGSTSLPDDYGYTATKEVCNSSKGITYTQSKAGTHYITFEDKGNNNGNYKKEGNNYVFVGEKKGKYIIKKIDIKNFTGASRYNATEVTVESCNNVSTDICPASWSSWHNKKGWVWSGTTLSKTLSKHEYDYAQSGEAYCLVKEADLNASNAADQNYLTRIKKICEPVEGQAGEYNCLTRLANLKKGFYQLINSSDITKDHNFAIGKYSSTNLSTEISFTSMTDEGKAKVAAIVQGLTANGGTPIASAYREASSIITTGNSVSNAKPSCSGNGIYFLTDGQPDPATTDFFEDEKVADSALDYVYGRDWYGNDLTTDHWRRVAGKAKTLYDGSKLIKTATVGFGGGYYLTSDYAKNGEFECSVYSHPEKGLCLWGTKNQKYGQGGFYNAQSAEDIVGSIKQFVSDVSVPVEGSTMGTSTIPVDALNSTQLQPYSYFPMFKPLIGTKAQLWVGNLKKFKVSNGSIYDTSDATVFDQDQIRAKLRDFWFSEAGSSDDDPSVGWGGHLSRLKANNLPKMDGAPDFNRKLFIDRDGELVEASVVLSDANKLPNSEYLYGLLGFSKLTLADFEALGAMDQTQQLEYLKTKTDARGHQLGSVIHSTPVLLTQKGAVNVVNGVQSSKNREDYIMFGTTQGVLHIVKAGQQDTSAIDANGGTDVFSFVPQEFIANQAKGFAESLAMERTDSVDTFFYGVDGPWVAHTVYEPQVTDNYKEVDGKKVLESTSGSLVVKANSSKSHQYVYGGLRMGGRSYYALNLSDMAEPKLMFHINPDAVESGPLSHMGQSWSKPSLAYIRWNGEKKLAMIVGGGYDKEYEDPAFTNNDGSKSVKGNGIYIFDAKNGQLLWWASKGTNTTADESSDAVLDSDGAVTTPAFNEIGTMYNSIPSRIKVIDRDGDGIADHLYTGDLGGKVFRIDLNPKHFISDDEDKNQPFTLNAFEFADLGQRRFYEPPTFTIHKSGMTRYAVLSMGSGDRSSPLRSSQVNDLLVGLYDYGVTQRTPSAQATILEGNLREIYKSQKQTADHKGWYYVLPKQSVESETYQSRIIEEGVALDNDLYMAIFDPRNSTAGENATSCTGGITGESTLYKFCLPDGDCGASKTSVDKVGKLGAGILGLTVGPGSKDDHRTFIFNQPPNPKPDEYVTANKLLPKKWFEYSPYKAKSNK